MDQLKEAGVVQYRFEPFIPEIQADERSIHYAITVEAPAGSPPYHQMSLISATASSTSPLSMSCVSTFIFLPACNQITKSYVNSIMQIAKLTSAYYQDYIYSRQLLQTVISNLPIGLCLLSVRGEINMVNRRFSMDLSCRRQAPRAGICSRFAPALQRHGFLASSGLQGDEPQRKASPAQLLELLLPNHEPPFTCSTARRVLVLADGTGDYRPPPDPVFFRLQIWDSIFTSFNHCLGAYEEYPEYARRLSL